MVTAFGLGYALSANEQTPLAKERTHHLASMLVINQQFRLAAQQYQNGRLFVEDDRRQVQLANPCSY